MCKASPTTGWTASLQVDQSCVNAESTHYPRSTQGHLEVGFNESFGKLPVTYTGWWSPRNTDFGGSDSQRGVARQYGLMNFAGPTSESGFQLLCTIDGIFEARVYGLDGESTNFNTGSKSSGNTGVTQSCQRYDWFFIAFILEEASDGLSQTYTVWISRYDGGDSDDDCASAGGPSFLSTFNMSQTRTDMANSLQ